MSLSVVSCLSVCLSASLSLSPSLDTFTVLVGTVLFSKFDTPVTVWFLVGNIGISIHLIAQQLDVFSVGVAVAYFAIAAIITTVLMMPVAKATYRVNESEGFFRSKHTRVKEYSECSACRCLFVCLCHCCVLLGIVGGVFSLTFLLCLWQSHFTTAKQTNGHPPKPRFTACTCACGPCSNAWRS